MKKTPARLLIVISSIMWGTTGTAQGLLTSANPLSVGAVRMFIGGVILFILGYKDINLKQINKKYVVVSSVAMALYQPLFFYAVKTTGVSIGTMFGLGSAPIFAGVIQLLMKQRLKKQWLIGTGVSVLGAVLIFTTKGEINVNFIGVFMALGAGLSYAVFAFSTGHLVDGNHPNSINGLIFMLSGILLIPLLFISDLSWLYSVEGILVAIHLGVVTTALAYTLFAYGLKKIKAHEAVTITLIEPLTAAILGFTLLKEPTNLSMILGISCIILGLLIMGKN